jgi:hypothetical protein
MEPKVDSNGRSYHCKECDKFYSSYKSLWKHTKNIHNNNVHECSEIVQQTINNVQECSTKSIQCNLCNKIFKTRSAKSMHKQKCIITFNNIKSETDKIKLEEIKLQQIKEETNKLKEEAKIMKEVNKKAEIEVKKAEVDVKKAEIEVKKINAEIKLAKLNGNTINSHNTTTNSNNTQINNGVINNTFYKLGDIPFDSLSKKDRDEIFNSPNMIETSIKKLHLNPLRPELCNIFISSLKDPYCIVFDGTQFVIKLKSEVLPDVVDMHLFEFETAKTKYNLNAATISKIDKLDYKINKNTKKYTDENDRVYKNYKEYMVEVVKLLIYNFCDKDMLEKIKKIKIFVRKELDEDSSDDDYDEVILTLN